MSPPGERRPRPETEGAAYTAYTANNNNAERTAAASLPPRADAALDAHTLVVTLAGVAALLVLLLVLVTLAGVAVVIA